MPYEFGVDVSAWQPGVDWRAVFATGRRFCFFKLDEGVTYHDQTAAANRTGSRAAGFILRGLYDFVRTTWSPEAQADFYCDDVVALAPGEVAVLDAEVNGLSADFCVRWAARVRVRLGAGTVCVLYCSSSYYWDDLRADSRLNDAFTFKWIAAYPNSGNATPAGDPRPSIPGALFWQYTDHAQVAGIGSCDDSVYDGSLTDLAALVGTATPTVPEEDTMAVVRVRDPRNGRVYTTDGITKHYLSPEENDVVNDLGIRLVAATEKPSFDDPHMIAFLDRIPSSDPTPAVDVDSLITRVAAAILAELPAAPAPAPAPAVDTDSLAAKIAAAISVHIDAPAIAASVSKVLGSKLSA